MPQKNHKILEKALLMLEYVSRNDGATLTEICGCAGIPKSSAHILLSTFVNMRYMKKNAKTGLYSLDIGSFELGSRFVENNDFYRYAREVLESLVGDTGETAHLAVLEGTDVVYLCKFECSHTVRMVSFVGRRIPAHATAVGKALLSGFGDDAIRALYADRELTPLTENTVCQIEELIAQIHTIRATGFSSEHEESTPGVECIAVPVLNRHSGTVQAGVSISVPIIRGKGDLERFKQPLLEAKASLEMIL